jgi:chromosome segregation ATPase
MGFDKENTCRTPAVTRGAPTPRTAVLSPLNFSPPRQGAVVPAASKESDDAVNLWKHIASELDAALGTVLRDAKEYGDVLAEKDERIVSLEREVDAAKGAHEEVAALLAKSMEREKDKAKKVTSHTSEIEEWRTKYQKLYQDAKAKLGLSAEKIEHYRSQLREAEQQSDAVSGKISQLEDEVVRLRSEAESRDAGVPRANEELTRVQHELRKAKVDVQRAESEVLDLQAKNQELEQENRRLRDARSPNRLSVGGSSGGGGPSSRPSLTSFAISPWKK